MTWRATSGRPCLEEQKQDALAREAHGIAMEMKEWELKRVSGERAASAKRRAAEEAGRAGEVRSAARRRADARRTAESRLAAAEQDVVLTQVVTDTSCFRCHPPHVNPRSRSWFASYDVRSVMYLSLHAARDP